MMQFMDFVTKNQTVIVGLLVAILDLLFALSKNLEGNGILHQVYLWLKGLKGGSDKAPPSAPAA